MNTSFKKTRRIVAAIALTTIATAVTASAQTQQNNQLALQLGAIQLGYTTNNSWTTNPQLLANALIQGQQALLATTTNKYTSYVVSTNTGSTNIPTNAPVAQSEAFRAELLQATLAALESPITYTNKVSPAIPVTVVNGKTGKQTTNKITALGFNPALTTPTAVLAIVSARVPNFDPALISNAVAATMMFTTNTNGVVYPVWGPQPAAASVKAAATNSQKLLTLNEKTEATQINNSAAVAKAALTAAVKAYAAGTKQWATFKASTGPTNGVTYLPNFGTKPLGPTGNPQAPDYKGLANAAAAVAANAINGLGSFNTNSSTNTSGLYGQTQANVTKLTTSLTQAALAYQTISTPTGTNSTKGYVSGALGAEALGLVTQVAGVNDTEWASAPTASLLQGIVSGAVAAVGKTSANLTFVATGIAQGFYATYLETTTDNPPMTPNQFAGITSVITTNGPVTFNNANDIIAAFKLAGVTQTELTKLGLNTAAQFSTYFNNVSTAISSGTNGVWANTISGAPGINLGGTNPPLLNGVGTPVTDTTGL